MRLSSKYAVLAIFAVIFQRRYLINFENEKYHDFEAVKSRGGIGHPRPTVVFRDWFYVEREIMKLLYKMKS